MNPFPNCCQLWLWPALVDFIGRNRAVEVALWRRAAYSADARDNVIGAASKTASPDVQMLESDVALQANDRCGRPCHPDFQQNIQPPYPNHSTTNPKCPLNHQNARPKHSTPPRTLVQLPHQSDQTWYPDAHETTQARPTHPPCKRPTDLLDFRPNRATHQPRTRNSLRNTQAPSP